MSPELRAVLERWAPLAHDTMGMLDDSPECIKGKPWDYSDYIRIFRLESDSVFLEFDSRDQCTSGRLKGIVGAVAQAHPWGSALILKGPLRWVGTRTQRATGLVKLAAEYLPALGQPKTQAFDETWPKMTLVLPCRWTP